MARALNVRSDNDDSEAARREESRRLADDHVDRTELAVLRRELDELMSELPAD